MGVSPSRSTLKLHCSAALAQGARHFPPSERGALTSKELPDDNDAAIEWRPATVEAMCCSVTLALSQAPPQSFPIHSHLRRRQTCRAGAPHWRWRVQWQSSSSWDEHPSLPAYADSTEWFLLVDKVGAVGRMRPSAFHHANQHLRSTAEEKHAADSVPLSNVTACRNPGMPF